MEQRKKHSYTILTIGWLGTILLILAYTLNSFGFIPSQGFWYPVLNLVAAILLGVRVFADRNYANTFLEIFWGGVAIVSLVSLFL
jgi:hypothetical protein